MAGRHFWVNDTVIRHDRAQRRIETVERGNAVLKSLSTHQATLEDVFVALTGRELRDA